MASQSRAPEHIQWSEPMPQLRRPTLITAFEGWNDAGDAATIAARHVAARWDCETVAEIDPEPFFDFTATRPMVHLDDQQARSLTWPSNEVRVAHMPGSDTDVVMLIGTEPQLRWRTFGEQVTGVGRLLGVERVITLGALLAEVPHSRDVEVYGSTDDDDLQTELDLTPSAYEGPTGIVGVLSAACLDAGYATASFWSAVPSYVPGAPSPKAALALVNRVCAAVGTPVPTTELERAAKAYELEVGRIVADDDETADYVARLEKAWDKNRARVRRRTALSDDPDTLVAEVEQFLRDSG